MKKIAILAVMMFGMMNFPAFGQATPALPNPPVVVVGNEKPIDIGQLIDLKASITGPVPANLVSINYVWLRISGSDVIEDFKLVQTDGSEIHSGTGKVKQTLTFIVIPFFKYRISPTDVEIQESKEIKVVVQVDDVPPPQPPTPPAPPSPPKPSLPEGQFKISQAIAENLVADTNLSSTEKVVLATTLSTSFKSITTKMDNDKTYRSFNQIYADTITSIKSGLAGKTLDVTKTAEFEKFLAGLMYDCYKNRGMSNANALQTAWGEVGLGLDWVAQNIK